MYFTKVFSMKLLYINRSYNKLERLKSIIFVISSAILYNRYFIRMFHTTQLNFTFNIPRYSCYFE